VEAHPPTGMGFQSNRAPTPRPFVSRRAEGNPDLQFSFSSFYFLIRNNGRNTNAAGISASPHMRGAFGGVDGGVACECASRVAARHGADAQGGGSMEAGRMIISALCLPTALQRSRS
jgi:hypothetical protein